MSSFGDDASPLPGLAATYGSEQDEEHEAGTPAAMRDEDFFSDFPDGDDLGDLLDGDSVCVHCSGVGF